MAKSIGLHIDIDVSGAKKAIHAAPAEMAYALHRGLEESAIYTQGIFRWLLPVGVSGYLRQHVIYTWNDLLSVSVYPTADYAKYIEYGTRPHWTSVHNLEAWAALKGINPYALQRSIAKRGTKAHPFLERTAEFSTGHAVRAVEASLKDAIRRINQ